MNATTWGNCRRDRAHIHGGDQPRPLRQVVATLPPTIPPELPPYPSGSDNASHTLGGGYTTSMAWTRQQSTGLCSPTDQPLVSRGARHQVGHRGIGLPHRVLPQRVPPDRRMRVVHTPPAAVFLRVRLHRPRGAGDRPGLLLLVHAHKRGHLWTRDGGGGGNCYCGGPHVVFNTNAILYNKGWALGVIRGSQGRADNRLHE